MRQLYESDPEGMKAWAAEVGISDPKRFSCVCGNEDCGTYVLYGICAAQSVVMVHLSVSQHPTINIVKGMNAAQDPAALFVKSDVEAGEAATALPYDVLYTLMINGLHEALVDELDALVESLNLDQEPKPKKPTFALVP